MSAPVEHKDAVDAGQQASRSREGLVRDQTEAGANGVWAFSHHEVLAPRDLRFLICDFAIRGGGVNRQWTPIDAN